MSNIESYINDLLNKNPQIKKIVKRIYQFAMYSISPKVKFEGDISRISPNDGMEYFFGYYDKSPWDISDRYMLCLRAKDTYKSVAPKEEADIILFDTLSDNSYELLGHTKSWNVQQGCMLQWLGPDFSERIIYNDFRDGRYCSVILNIKTKEEKVIEMPVYNVSKNGKFALSLDFSRLHRLRKGYGYSNIPEITEDEKCPNKPCIWYIDLESGDIKPLLNYADFANFESRLEMKDAEHKVNHIMLNPSGSRFMVLHRWFKGSRKYTRLITINLDCTEMYNLSDDDMVSHCCWKNDEEILAYERKKGTGNGYYLMIDRTRNYERLWPELVSDGHPSYSPDGRVVVTDTYPDRARIANIYCMYGEKIINLAKVFAPFRYDNDVRCDLHPRWNRKGDKVCFDSVFKGYRGLYVVGLANSNTINMENKKEIIEGRVSCVIPTYKRSDTLLRAIRSVLNQTYSDIEVVVVDDNNPNDEYSLIVQQKLNAIDDNRVHYIQQDKHINGAVARNVGIKAAQGEYIALLDDDDEWLPEKVEKQVEYLKKHDDVGGCSCLYRICLAGKTISKCLPYTGENLQFKVLDRQVAIYTSTFLCKKNIIEESGAFDSNLLRHQDLQVFTDFLNFASIEPIQEYLVVLNADSEINKPNVKKLINVKKAFFISIKDTLSKYSKKEQRRIKSAHNFEIAFAALKQKKIGIAIEYILKASTSIQAYRDVFERYTARKNS